MSAIDVISEFQNKDKYNLCCSESIMYAASKYYGLNLSEDTLKASAAFCGGNLTEDTCGLLTASIAVIAIMFVEDNSHSSPLMKEYIVEYTKSFKEKYSSNNCASLKKEYRDINTGCKGLIIDSFDFLTKFIDSKLK